MTTLTLPPIQYDPDIDRCLHTIDLNMIPTEDQRSWLQRLAPSKWVYLVILTSYTAGVAMGAILAT